MGGGLVALASKNIGMSLKSNPGIDAAMYLQRTRPTASEMATTNCSPK